ncbi:MAG: hypothetical protein IJU50_06370 [Lachnospiraceae bacterium]|nr:hypothetical protein [Lachnospiraceae bacterium]
MHKAVEDALEGKFRYATGGLTLTPESISFKLHEGGVLEGSFSITGAPGLPLFGQVYCFDSRMELPEPRFSGDSEMVFRFQASGLPLGTTHKGSFQILSSQMEYVLPYTIEIDSGQLQSYGGQIRSIFEFTNLARRDWDEALRLFDSDSFPAILPDQDMKTLCRGFRKKKGSSSNLDAFLCAIRKKTPIEYRFRDKAFSFEMPEGGFQEAEILISKNGWGHARLEASAVGGFLSLESALIEEQDFSEDVAALKFRVNADLLHPGKNLGLIKIKSLRETWEIPVSASKKLLRDFSRLDRQKNLLALMNCYETFRLHKMNRGEWLIKSEAYLGKILSIDSRDMEGRLFEIQLLISSRRKEEAAWLLEELQFRVETEGTIPMRAFFLYLQSLYSGLPEDARKAAEFTAQSLEQKPGDWRLRWLFLYVSDVLDNSPGKKFMFLEEACLLGCASPLIYLEGWVLLQEYPELLQRMNRFGRGLLAFGISRGLLEERILQRAAAIAVNERKYSGALEQVLLKAYDFFPRNEILNALVTVILKRKPCPRHLPIFDEALKRNLQVTGLLDSYLQAINRKDKREYPTQVLLYAAEAEGTDWQIRAHLFALALRKKEKLPEMQKLQEAALRFTEKMLSFGRLNEDLGFLYGAFSEELAASSENANALSKLLFVRMIKVREGMRAFAVYKNLWQEQYAQEGDAGFVLPVYDTSDYVFLEDSAGNTLLLDNASDQVPLLQVSKVFRELSGKVDQNPLFDLQAMLKVLQPKEEDLEGFLRVFRSPEISAEPKRLLFTRLLPLLPKIEDAEKAGEVLSLCAVLPLSGKEKKALVSQAMGRGRYGAALKAMLTGEIASFDPMDVLKTGVRLLERRGSEGNMGKELVDLLVAAFEADHYTMSSILFLCEYWPGSLASLEKLIRLAFYAISKHEPETEEDKERSEEILTGLAERMLIQSLATGQPLKYPEAIYSFLKDRGMGEETLQAYLYRKLFEAFVLREDSSEFFYSQALERALYGGELKRIGKLALISHFASPIHPLPNEAAPLFREWLRNFALEEQVFLPEFKDYSEIFPEGEILEDKTIFVRREDPEAEISMVMEGKALSLDTVFPGVYSKAFVIYPGEPKEYVLSIKHGERLSEEKGELACQAGARDHTRFGALAGILRTHAQGDDSKTLDKAFDYCKQEFLVSDLFGMK